MQVVPGLMQGMPKGLHAALRPAMMIAKGGMRVKIRLEVCAERYDDVADELEARGIEISDDADLILCESGAYLDFLRVRRDGETYHLPVDEVIMIESFGHEVLVHAHSGQYRTTERLRRLEVMLEPSQFIRISNSVMIAKREIRHIRAMLSSKYIVTMSDGSQADVTRTYYAAFREAPRL